MLLETQFEGFGAEVATSLLEQIKEALQDDPSLDTVIAAAADPDSMPHSVAAKFKDYTLQDGLLLYQGRIVVPDEPEIKQQLLSHLRKLPQLRTLLSYRGPTFNSKFLRALYKALQIAPSYSTAYHLQSDGQTEIKNQWLESYLRPFINHRQSDWVEWLPLAEFNHNNAKSKATGKSPFEIVYGRSPMISPALEPTGSPAADDRAKQLADTIQEVQASIKWAQERYKQADKGKQPPEFAPGDKVWLLASNITSQQPNKKLDHKQYGPFSVLERIGSHAYWLTLPETMKIHDVFHVSWLTAYKSDTEFKRHFTPPPPVITAEGEEEYQVDKFVDWAAEDGIWKYRVRWKGYAPHEDTWEPAKDLQHCGDQLREFFANYPIAPKVDDLIPTDAPKVKKGRLLKRPNKPKTARFASLRFASAALRSQPPRLLHNRLQHAQAMKDNLSSAANIIHVLLSASNRRNVRRVRRNTYKHPRWGFMYWLDPEGVEGPQTLYGVRVYCCGIAKAF
ncbi:Retrotransposable element Tf2 155 kDa protein type 1 [Rhizoctonia solani AG-1 IB]|uniref:Retrotransposable element Tf2 155 kDa protein type 1 n=1 Tax=Thanatephorus cucumeris (strain AG1-IB / isolate 7/3/14) TaxID=1108050 RepID=M5C5S5_THACB|nr:Retrotransposable element Tf2 155 kDa protein type 1 [Rhizoctonia solani AG-1 IB]